MNGTTTEYDVIVVGLGIYGSTIAAAAAEAGLRVIALERDRDSQTTGSSHGGSRLVRRATLEDAAYSSLVDDAISRWQALDPSHSFFVETAAVIVDQGATGIHHGARNVARAAGATAQALEIQHAMLGNAGLRRVAPWLPLDRHTTITAYVEAHAYVLDADAALAAARTAALHAGADLRFDVQVTAIDSRLHRAQVATSEGHKITAGSCVVAVGAWLPSLFPNLEGARPVIYPQLARWYGRGEQSPPLIDMPFVLARRNEPLIYGFPDYDGKGVKLACENELWSVASADSDRTGAKLHDFGQALDQFAAQLGCGPSIRQQRCLYTVMPDSRLWMTWQDACTLSVSCCSGHGFKYAPAIASRVVQELARQHASVRVGVNLL